MMHQQQQPSGGGGNGVGFFFQRRQGMLDWRRIAAVDLDRVVREVDVDTLQANVENITFSDVNQNDLAFFNEANFIKLFRMCQLTIEYLLNVQNYFIKQNGEQQAQLTALQQRLADTELADKKKEVEIKSMKREMRYSRKVLKAYENTIGKMSQPGGAGKRVTASGDVVYKCEECSAAFISEPYLAKHMAKRHPLAQYDGRMHIASDFESTLVQKPNMTARGGGGGGGMDRNWLEQWGDKVVHKMESSLKLQSLQAEHHVAERLSKMQEDFKTFVQGQLMSLAVQRVESSRHGGGGGGAAAAGRHRAMAGPLMPYDSGHHDDGRMFPEQSEMQARVIHDKLDRITDRLHQNTVSDTLMQTRLDESLRVFGELRSIVTSNLSTTQQVLATVTNGRGGYLPTTAASAAAAVPRPTSPLSPRYDQTRRTRGAGGHSSPYPLNVVEQPVVKGKHMHPPEVMQQAETKIHEALSVPDKSGRYAKARQDLENEHITDPTIRNLSESLVRDYTPSPKLREREDQVASMRRQAQGARGLDRGGTLSPPPGGRPLSPLQQRQQQQQRSVSPVGSGGGGGGSGLRNRTSPRYNNLSLTPHQQQQPPLQQQRQSYSPPPPQYRTSPAPPPPSYQQPSPRGNTSSSFLQQQAARH